MAVEWSFLTNHARALLFIAGTSEPLLRSIAAELGITERTAFGIISDLTAAGYVVKHKDGRRNRYAIQRNLPLPDPEATHRTVGDMLDLLVDIGKNSKIAPSVRAKRVAPGA